MSATNYLENKILDHVLSTTSYTMPSDAYVSLHTADPTEAGTGTEVSGGSYARQSAAFNAATGGSTSNSALIQFSNMPTATVTHFGIWDAVTGGNILLYGELSSSKSVTAGDTIAFNAGTLTISVD